MKLKYFFGSILVAASLAVLTRYRSSTWGRLWRGIAGGGSHGFGGGGGGHAFVERDFRGRRFRDFDGDFFDFGFDGYGYPDYYPYTYPYYYLYPY